MKKTYNAMEAVLSNQLTETRRINFVAAGLSLLTTGIMISALSALFG